MRKSPDLNVMHRTCVFLRNYLKHDIGIVILGNDLVLNDWTEKKTIYCEKLDNQGLERFCFQILHLRDSIYQLWQFQYADKVSDYTKYQKAIEHIISIYGYIPKLL